MPLTIFYAWQSDRPGKTNRNLIKDALTKAIAELNEEAVITEDPRDEIEVDHDTRGVPGSPDISATILEKIDQAAVFVCDVTPIAERAGGTGAIPNPNVMLELGYAMKALDSKRIITVMNTAFGAEPRDLPFDIKQKSVIKYAADQNDLNAARKGLQSSLKHAVKSSLDYHKRTLASVEPTVAPEVQLVRAIKDVSPEQRALAEAYFKSLLARMQKLRPAQGDSDEDLLKVIAATAPMVSEFVLIAESIAQYKSVPALEEARRFFVHVLEAYYPVSYTYLTDYDLYKFLGHELLVVLIAKLIKEDHWEALRDFLQEPFRLRAGRRSGKSQSFVYLSVRVDLLQERNERLGLGRAFLHADILKDRYSTEPLARLLSWEEFMEADHLLLVRSCVKPNDGATWFPWSAIYLEESRQELPDYIENATTKRGAERLALGLGMNTTLGLRVLLADSTSQLKSFLGSHSFRVPGLSYDWTKIWEEATAEAILS